MPAIGIARGKAPSRGGLGEGVRVKVRARWFGDDWAKETFGKTWTMAFHQSLPRKRIGGALGGKGTRSTKNRASDALSGSKVVPRGLGRPQVARYPVIMAFSVRYTRTLQPQNPEAS